MKFAVFYKIKRGHVDHLVPRANTEVDPFVLSCQYTTRTKLRVGCNKLTAVNKYSSLMLELSSGT